MSPTRQNKPDDNTIHGVRELTDAHWAEFSKLATGKAEEIFRGLFADTDIHQLGPALSAASVAVPQVIGDFCTKHHLCYGCIGPVLTALIYRQMFMGLAKSIDGALGIEFIGIDADTFLPKSTIQKPTAKEKNTDDRN